MFWELPHSQELPEVTSQLREALPSSPVPGEAQEKQQSPQLTVRAELPHLGPHSLRIPSWRTFQPHWDPAPTLAGCHPTPAGTGMAFPGTAWHKSCILALREGFFPPSHSWQSPGGAAAWENPDGIVSQGREQLPEAAQLRAQPRGRGKHPPGHCLARVVPHQLLLGPAWGTAFPPGEV